MLRRNEDILCNSRRGAYIFCLSAPNWALLKAFQTEAKNVTLKHLSSTRWESRHNSIFALIQQYSNITTTLCHLKLTSTDSSMRRNADQLSEKITTMEFLVLLFVWEKILRAVYAVSKQLQSKSVNLATSAALLGETVDFIRNPRNEFDSMCDSTKELAKKVGMKVAFKDTRARTKKRFFDELASDYRLETSREKFRVTVVVPVIDTCLGQLNTRFESLQSVIRIFSFLFPEQLLKLSDSELELQSTEFVKIYSQDVSNDIGRQVLAFRACAGTFIKAAENPMNVLNTLLQLDLNACFPDLVTAYFIFLTLPVSVASNERSFSKLKIIKSYLRSVMGQERLSNLGILSIERDRFSEIDRNSIIRSFAQSTARKKEFL